MATKEHGFIKLYRSMTDWEWYTDGPTKAVFLHLLLTANYRPGSFKGVTIGRGQRAASYGTLARECGLTESQARTAVMHLKRTGEITAKAYQAFSLITVCNYERFQGTEENPPAQAQGKPQPEPAGTQGAEASLAPADGRPVATTKEGEEVLEIFRQYAKGEEKLILTLQDFAEMRAGRGRPMTRRAARLLCGRLDKLKAAGEDVCACLENSVLYGWTGVYPAGDAPKGAVPRAQARKKAPRGTEIFHSGRYDFAAIEQAAREKLARGKH